MYRNTCAYIYIYIHIIVITKEQMRRPAFDMRPRTSKSTHAPRAENLHTSMVETRGDFPSVRRKLTPQTHESARLEPLRLPRRVSCAWGVNM